ncbi:hypothetical protein GCK72_019930 [Caenorhabditis remanei]|uniref:BHLH domain-containing protein n=1 Tax=Caenorhabditis remanei TaxID=31234 RepID=A0A6A5GFD0_CAERE|nr:hypothetical protein GCK72_019930 [Caenorhabditis remanei]KAF1753373.1 hypothetical protein GCK72_019930 [Caenorhabditis remanei]
MPEKSELHSISEFSQLLGMLSDQNENEKTRKVIKEKERRDYNNQLLVVLKNLVQGPQDSNLNVHQVLIKSHQTVTQLHKQASSDPQTAGFLQGLAKAETIVIRFIESLHFEKKSCQEHINVIKQVFASKSGGEKLETGEGSSSSSPKMRSDQTDRKEIKKNREQYRRDRHTEGYNALEDFITKQNLLPPNRGKLHKIDILQTIIKYIKETRVVVSNQSAQHQLPRTVGFLEGLKKGKDISIQFFQSNANLFGFLLSLNAFFEFNVNPQPLFGFPTGPAASPFPVLPAAVPIDVPAAKPTEAPAPVAANSVLAQLLQLMLSNSSKGIIPPLPMTPTIPHPTPASPTGSMVTSESSASDNSSPSSNNSSGSSSPELTDSQSPKKVFRPWLPSNS